MKKIWIYIVLILSLTSCNDLLDVTCETGVTYQNYFKSESDLESVVISMLAGEVSIWGSGILSMLEQAGMPCDDYYDEGFRNLKYSVFTNVSNGIAWGNYYNIIYFANMLEDNRVRFEGMTDERIDFWLAQANYIKALAYFEVARTWGDAPIPKNSTVLEGVGKSPVKDVLLEAVRCAEKALILPTHDNLLDSKGRPITSKQYASLGTVNTLLANIYAWMGGLYGEGEYWTKAEAYASEVIEGRSGFYKLESNIASLLENTLGPKRSSDETIFNIEVNDSDRNYYYSTDPEMVYPGVALINYPYFTSDAGGVIDRFRKDTRLYRARIKAETVKQLYDEAGDVRRDSFWYRLGEVTYEKKDDETGGVVNETSPYAYFAKWRSVILSENPEHLGVPVGMQCNRVIWRLADLMLLRAECRARLGASNATDDLNEVRERAGLGKYQAAAGIDLRRAIFRERERELFGEGQRYFDIVRNGYLDQLSTAYRALTSENIQNGALYLPVSQNAFKKNDLMKQNTYWLWRK